MKKVRQNSSCFFTKKLGLRANIALNWEYFGFDDDHLKYKSCKDPQLCLEKNKAKKNKKQKKFSVNEHVCCDGYLARKLKNK